MEGGENLATTRAPFQQVYTPGLEGVSPTSPVVAPRLHLVISVPQHVLSSIGISEVSTDKRPAESFPIVGPQEQQIGVHFVGADVSKQVDQMLRAMQDRAVITADVPHVRGFLLRHTSLIPELPRIVQTIGRDVDDGTQILLDVFAEPESGSEYLSFSLRLPDYKSPEWVMEAFRGLSRDVRATLGSLSNRVLVTTDFESPQ